MWDRKGTKSPGMESKDTGYQESEARWGAVVRRQGTRQVWFISGVRLTRAKEQGR